MKFSRYNLIIPHDKFNFIMFNTLTGNIVLVERSLINIVKSRLAEQLPAETFGLLKQCGFIIPDDFDERKVYSYYYNKSRFHGDSTSVTILLTNMCNFRCTYCYEGAGDAVDGSLDREKSEQIAKFIINTSNHSKTRFVNVMLFGGEPLLNIEEGFYILSRLKSYCDENEKVLTTSIVTNGSLLSTSILEQLIAYNCKSIQITLDGPPEIHNTRRVSKSGGKTFDQVLNGIKIVEKYADNIRCVVRINIDKTNSNQVDHLLLLLKNADIKRISIDYGIVRGSTDACASYSCNCFSDKELGPLLNDLWIKAENSQLGQYPQVSRKWIYCGLLSDNSFTIDPLGDVYKCWEMVGDEKHKIGKISESGYLINCSYPYFDWMAIDPLKIPKCAKCKYLPACGGGCIMVGYKDTGSYHSSGCAKVKGVVEKQVHTYAKRVLERRKATVD